MAAGRPEIGASLALSVVLVAMPPLRSRVLAERARTLLTRTACLTGAGIYVWLIGGHAWLLVAGVTATAAAGALLPRVGTTAPLAVLLVGITGSGAAPAVPGLEQLAGGLWASALLLPRWGRHRLGASMPAGSGRHRSGASMPSPVTSAPAAPATSSTSTAPAAPASAPGGWRHAARLTVLTGAVSSLLTLGGLLGGEMHWLVTSVLQTTRPTARATRLKGARRVLGNTLGGVAAAVLLLLRPGPVTVAVVIGLVGAAGYAWAPVDSLSWSLASPLLMLPLADFARHVPWYAAGIRAGLSVLGAVLALLAARLLWPVPEPPVPEPPAPGRR
ncbi:FUSC family protein [Streptomyces sp. CBMA370]|uniref:FUSC family protein n=1 Tax=Streptomyces sp. CBMA370 TaxID=1930278 RepID=UPI001661D982|nr:FUSC family protein [Streptomyces sp. CBMA370]